MRYFLLLLLNLYLFEFLFHLAEYDRKIKKKISEKLNKNKKLAHLRLL